MKIISNKELSRWYTGFNRKYFKGQLPKNTIVRFEKIVPCGMTRRKIFARINSAPGISKTFYRFTITINKRMKDSRSLTIPTLLHEMIHVEHWEWRGHGHHFQKRMLKLANAGAFNGWW